MCLVVAAENKASFYPLWLGMSLLIYWLGHIGIYKFGVTIERKKLRNYSIENKSTYAIIDKQKSEHIATLENLIVTQKKYLDSNLNLERLADELNLSKSYLSRTINAELGVGLLNAEERVEMNTEEHSGFKYQLE